MARSRWGWRPFRCRSCSRHAERSRLALRSTAESRSAPKSTRLPTTIAIVGGRTIASLLRAADQDRLADGTVGWWFYLNFTASPVRYLP